MKKTLYLTYGLPGSGKSTLAKAIQDQYAKSGIICPIYEADDYFVREDGTYVFEKEKAGQAHKYCFGCVIASMAAGQIGIVVANTNLTWKDIKPYVNLAYTQEYRTSILEPETPWQDDIEQLLVKNIHNVPRETLERMAAKKQEIGYLREKIKQVYSHEFEW